MQKITEYRTPEGYFDADIDITKLMDRVMVQRDKYTIWVNPEV